MRGRLGKRGAGFIEPAHAEQNRCAVAVGVKQFRIEFQRHDRRVQTFLKASCPIRGIAARHTKR